MHKGTYFTQIVDVCVCACMFVRKIIVCTVILVCLCACIHLCMCGTCLCGCNIRMFVYMLVLRVCVRCMYAYSDVCKVGRRDCMRACSYIFACPCICLMYARVYIVRACMHVCMYARM